MLIYFNQLYNKNLRLCSVNSLCNICEFKASGESQTGLKATAEGFSHSAATPYVLMLNKNQILQN